MRKGATAATLIAGWLFFGSQQANAQARCSFPRGNKTTVSEMIASIEKWNAACALPWRALKAAAQSPENVALLNAAYDDVAAKFPQAQSPRYRKADVAAAAGQPEMMLALADKNVRDHPEDKSFAAMSCFARGRYGFDVENAMPFCNAAVSGGRQAYTLTNRGRVELELKQDAEALLDFNEAIGSEGFSTHPMFAEAVYGRGIARLRVGDKKGNSDIAMARRLNPQVDEIFEDGGVVLPIK